MKEQANLAKIIFSRRINRRQLLIGGTKGFTGFAAGAILGIDKDPKFPESLRFRKLERLSLKLLQHLNQEPQNNRPELAEDIPSREWAHGVGELINKFRIENNLHPLSRQPALTAAAEGYAKFIVENGYTLSLEPRTGHSLDGRTAGQRAQAQGYTGLAVGENIGVDAVGPEGILQAWLNSPDHRVGILNFNFKELGVGCYRDSNNPYIVCVADFGIPTQSLPIELEIESGYSHVSAIFNLDNQTQRWSWYLYGLPTEKNTIIRFEKGKIYFLFSKAYGPFSMGPVPKMQINPGWNNFAWPGP